MSFIARLSNAIANKRNPVCVGLDPRRDQLPPDVVQASLQPGKNVAESVALAFEIFCQRVIDVVSPLVAVVKPQAAFFEEWGPPGMKALQNVIRYARDRGLLVICDAKRGDIGSTAEAYARAFLAGSDRESGIWGADALTVNPYMGPDTLLPFVKVAVQRGAGIYVLVRTSNPGAAAFQELHSDGIPVFQHIAKVVEELADETRGADRYGAVGAVVGATCPEQLAHLRHEMPHAHFLIPGYGSQGGTAADVASAFHPGQTGAIINNSRGIIFAYEREEFSHHRPPGHWQDAIEESTRLMIADLNATCF